MNSNTIKMICVSIFFALFNMQVFAEDGVDPGELSDIQEKTGLHHILNGVFTQLTKII